MVIANDQELQQRVGFTIQELHHRSSAHSERFRPRIELAIRSLKQYNPVSSAIKDAHTSDDLASLRKQTMRLKMVNWLHDLRRELRDIVYEYALTKDGGLAVDMWDDISHALDLRAAKENGTKTDSNQLRHVCRQLHSEISGLGLQHNVISLKDPRHGRDVVAEDYFARFVKSCAPAHLAVIRRIVLLDYFAETIGTGVSMKYSPDSTIQGHCRSYPETDVIVRLNGRYRHLDRTIASMNALHFIKHGTHVFAGILESPTAQLAAWYISSAQSSMHFERPSNLRFSGTFEFEEHLVHRGLAGIYEEKDIPKMMTVARKLHESGI
ncbi:hypothetical protein FB567DRAFT_583481 [Paraphoma chrysanthemicola]|uniref:Uncharacterized protein n=1 Tax=Paraphoma chrysanthemicola TaxID=798071 RepID=A0A8K0QWT3_9PLEO|nr:hypothetical protein FB567DRAFT_583481 [Paraphoma chrysanthemicola]